MLPLNSSLENAFIMGERSCSEHIMDAPRLLQLQRKQEHGLHVSAQLIEQDRWFFHISPFNDYICQ
jgi:hypothetical protein